MRYSFEFKKEWTAEERYVLVAQVIAGQSYTSVAINEVIKKEIALIEEKKAARLKAKKQRLLKNSVTKDTN